MELLGGPGEVTMAVDRFDVSKLAQLHRAINHKS
jgi:hypothetical protein